MDDELDISNLGKIFLEKINPQLKVKTCNSGIEALELFESENFDAIVSDYQMPVMSGLEFLEKVRKKDKDIPFIIFTGRGAESVAMKALNLGANRYFQKIVNNLNSQYELLAQAINQEIHFRDSKIKTRRLERVLKAIRNVNQFIVRESNLENLLQGICDRLIETKGCITCCIFYARGKKSIFRMSSIEKIQKPPPSFFNDDLVRSNCYKSLLRGIKNANNKDFTFTEHECKCLFGTKNYMIFAKELISNGNSYGIIAISLDTSINLDEEEKSLFLELTSDISYALYNLEIEEKRRMMQTALVDKAEVLRYAPVGVGSFDKNFKILVVNKKFEEITGFSLKDLSEKKFYDLFSNINDFDKIREELVVKPFKPIKIDSQWIAKNGSIISVSLLISKTSNNNAYTFTIFDISEVVLAREHERFLKTLFSHESKNIAHTIKGYFDLIDKTKLSTVEQEYLINIIKKAEENTRLFNKVFTLMGENRKDSIINISSVINEALQKNNRTLKNQGIKVECNLLDINVKSSILLVELFDNLIQNSVKHSKCKKIRITTKSNDNTILVFYEDNGIGIKKESQQYLFQKGFNGKRKGFGYGTYLMRKIVEDYDGTIEYMNSDLGGAGFKINLKC
ncbi:MAG: response regulator [Candidatus Hodarchaeales archaeon]